MQQYVEAGNRRREQEIAALARLDTVSDCDDFDDEANDKPGQSYLVDD